MVLAKALRELVRDALREEARVDEDQGGLESANEPREAVVDVAPLLTGGDGFEVGGRHFDLQVEVALVTEVDDGAIGAYEVGAFDFDYGTRGCGKRRRSGGDWVRWIAHGAPRIEILSYARWCVVIVRVYWSRYVVGADEEGGDFFYGPLGGAETDTGGALLA